MKNLRNYTRHCRDMRTLAFSSNIFASQTLTIANLGSVAGEWTLTLDTPQGPFDQSPVFTDEGGKAPTS